MAIIVATPGGAPQNKPQLVGQMRVTLVDLASFNYPTGGEAITPEQFGMKKILAIFVQRNADGTHGAWDSTNAKIKSFVAAGTETANAGTFSFRAQVWGV